MPIALGPRLGRKFKRDGGGPTPPHDLNIAAIGAVILWFGWYGFNPGSTLSAMDFEGIGRVAANTTLAACAGGMVAVLFVYPRSKKWDVGMSINGFLGGLVAVTAPCYWVSPAGAVIGIFYRHIGLDPDESRTPIEAASLERLRAGGFKSHGLVDDAITIAHRQNRCRDAGAGSDRISGRLQLRIAEPEERLGGEKQGLKLPDGTLVIADDQVGLPADLRRHLTRS